MEVRKASLSCLLLERFGLRRASAGAPCTVEARCCHHSGGGASSSRGRSGALFSLQGRRLKSAFKTKALSTIAQGRYRATAVSTAGWGRGGLPESPARGGWDHGRALHPRLGDDQPQLSNTKPGDRRRLHRSVVCSAFRDCYCFLNGLNSLYLRHSQVQIGGQNHITK